MKRTARQFIEVVGTTLQTSLLALLFTFTTANAIAAKADDLHARWRLVSEDAFLEFGYLYFEKNGRLYIEEFTIGKRSDG